MNLANQNNFSIIINIIKLGMLFVFTLFSLSDCGINDYNVNNKKEINPKLKQILFWGRSDPSNSAPNILPPTGPDILFPLWKDKNSYYCYTGIGKNGELIKGIFEIIIDDNLNFENFKIYEFANSIWHMEYDKFNERLLLIYFINSSFSLVSVNLISETVQIQEELVSSDWKPYGINIWPGKPGIVFFGENPNNGIKGFYWRYISTSGNVDSLLYETSLSKEIARGFSITKDGKYLLFGISSDTSSESKVQLLKFNILSHNSNPIVLLEREGSFISVDSNPQNYDQILFNYSTGGDSENPPENVIELVDITNSVEIKLDIRTSEFTSRFIIANYPKWDPNGRNFIFSASDADGEGGITPKSLWIYENVP